MSEDLIHLDLTIFTALSGAGALSANAFLFVEDGDEVVATTADQRIIYDSVNGDIYYDAHGSWAGEMKQFAHIESGLVIGEENFVVIL